MVSNPTPERYKQLSNCQSLGQKLYFNFLGIVNYLSRFSPNIAKMTINLPGLLRKGNEFIWQEQHSNDFQAIIHELCSPKLLKYYDSKKDLYLEVDASQKAIGMALLQSNKNDHDHSEAHGVDKFKLDARLEDSENKPIPHDLMPVAYGSKTLTDAESQYANIERELLGVVARVE